MSKVTSQSIKNRELIEDAACIIEEIHKGAEYVSNVVSNLLDRSMAQK